MAFGKKEINATKSLLSDYNLFLEQKLVQKDVLDKALAEYMQAMSSREGHAVVKMIRKIKN
jgi:hypothetical protein